MSFPKNEKGFTLLEALLVVVIIAIIAAVAIPRFMFAKSDAETNTCRNNKATIRVQVERYYADHGEYPSDSDSFLSDTNYFPDGEPTCPADDSPEDGSYSVDSTTGSVTCDIHDAGGTG